MEKKNYNEEFLEFINNENRMSFRSYLSKVYGNIKNTEIVISGLYIENISLSEKDFFTTTFQDCTLENVVVENSDFMYTNFEFCIFNNCEFYNCNYTYSFFDSSIFYECELLDIIYNVTNFSNVGLYDSTLNNIHYNNSDLIDVKFNKGIYTGLKIETTSTSPKNTFTFIESKIDSSMFMTIDMQDVNFIDVIFNKITFVDCRLSEDTFSLNINYNKNSCLIDLQTILKSDINEETFKLFGVHGFDPKGYIKDLVTEMKFQSVFISYSFEDKEFARALSHILMTRGIKSFFWERDAPGGRRLKKIMYENIHSHDRLLFIASKNSLKSEACHYELNEAREKQNKEWGEIYFPIHIDSYLFEVRKEDIPRKHRDAFWENIEEVKEFNSKDFSSFKTKEDYKSKEFEEAVVQLIKDLKL